MVKLWIRVASQKIANYSLDIFLVRKLLHSQSVCKERPLQNLVTSSALHRGTAAFRHSYCVAACWGNIRSSSLFIISCNHDRRFELWVTARCF